MRTARMLAVLLLVAVAPGVRAASYVNLESSHVHPIDLTPSGRRLLAVNTPDALLEVFDVLPGGALESAAAIPVGLEPVTVVARSDSQAWVVNRLSDSVSLVDLDLGIVTQTLVVGDEPTDVAFAAGRAFVAVSGEDLVRVYTLANLNLAPAVVPLAGRDVRALAVAPGGQKVHAVVLQSGNRTTVVGAHQAFPASPHVLELDPERLAALGLRDVDCDGAPPVYPPLPAGVVRNPALVDPPDGVPKVGLIVGWDAATERWLDEAGQDWSACLPYRLADHDLFTIDATTLAVTTVSGLGTTLFDVSVQPQTGRVWVPNTDARNRVRFEHPLGLTGHVVDNRLSVVDPANGQVTIVDLNSHIDRGSDPHTNLAERAASVSQPGMMVWRSDGSAAWLTAIGSRKLFRVEGGCLAGNCIFGPDRAAPQAVEVGDGPSGVALLEAQQPADERLYVLNRFSHSIAIVAVSSLELVDVVPLHDPSSPGTRAGRKFLYDAVDGSAHGDAACASCHVSGDVDGLAWDLGNPAGVLVPYGAPLDNVRFISPEAGEPVPCEPEACAAHEGFDPQKGPMTTQPLRGLLEPLHWRGDRATIEEFNATFVTLLGRPSVGAPGGEPAGLTPVQLEWFRQFLSEISFGPNPHRTLGDETPCGPRQSDPLCEITVPSTPFAGNPTEGYLLFVAGAVADGQPCTSCHVNPFGVAGGHLGGVIPTEPTSNFAAALVNGNGDRSPHSDLKVPQLRSLHEKLGPVLAPPGQSSLPLVKSGFGFAHDGAVPDLWRFLASTEFDLSPAVQAREVRDLASFLLHFPTEMKNTVGRQVTLPPGPPPTAGQAAENLLAQLLAMGDLTLVRYCDLAASTLSGGELRRFRFEGGLWRPDRAQAPPLTTYQLRAAAQAPVTFICGTIGSGARLGGNRDEDALLDGDDCAPADPGTLVAPGTVTNLALDEQLGTAWLTWDAQANNVGPSVRYDVLAGDLSALATTGVVAVDCDASGLALPYHGDATELAAGNGRYYLVRAGNPCGVGDLGPGLDALEALSCP